MTLRPDRRTRGFSLVELMIVLGLIAVFMVIAARLFTSMMRLSQQSRQAEARLVNLDSVVRMLRADVWGAGEMSADPSGNVTLVSGSKLVVWNVNESGAVTRAESVDGVARAQRWPDLGGLLRLKVEGPVLVVSGEPRAGRAGELRLVSQVLLVGVTR